MRPAFEKNINGAPLRFFCCLLAGSAIGALFCNGMNDEMKVALGSLESSLISTAYLRHMDFFSLFFAVLKKRLSCLFLAFLMALTPISGILLPFLVFGLGFSSSVLICALTMDFGLFGLPAYLLFMFPQGMPYGLAIYLLLWWMPEHERFLRFGSAATLTGICLIGVAAESFLNPWLLSMFSFWQR